MVCREHEDKPGDILFTYDVPEPAFADKEHVVEVTAKPLIGPTMLRITRVEFVVKAAGNY